MTVDRSLGVLAAAAVLGICLGMTNASAQPGPQTIGGIRVLPAGATVRGTAGAAGSVDVFAIVTIPGERHTFTLRSTSAKPVELLFIDPAGNVVLSKSGLREITLDAVASFAEAYALAVVRADPSVPFTLQRTTVPTTMERAMAALAVGYELKQSNGVVLVRCWVVPGQKVRETLPKAVIENEALPGALFRRWITGTYAGRTTTATYSINGDAVAEITRGPSGEATRTFDFTPEMMEQSLEDKFTGYLC